MNDERKGKPSASGFDRLALCPGSFQLESTLPEQEPNEWMQLGTDVHAVLAGEKEFETLSEEGQEIATRCLSEFSELIGNLGLERTKELLEQRYWYEDLFSGQIDRIDFFGDETALITDYKTGRTPQSKVAENYQLRAYAVLVKRAFPELKKVMVAIIQPLARQKTIVEYDEADLAAAEQELVGIVSASLKQDAPRIPSPDACKWCRAKGICWERLDQGQATTKELEVVSKVVVSSLSNNELVALDDKAEIVEDFIQSIRDEIKSRLLAGQNVDGRELKKGRTMRTLTDTNAVLSALSSVLSPDTILACAKISVASLEKEFAKASGLKPKDAKPKLHDALGWLLETKDGEPTVTRAK